MASRDIQFYSVDYSSVGPFADLSPEEANQLLLANAETGISYDVSIDVPETMDPPIYVNFRLGKYFQNYRRYVRSFDPNQMHDGTTGPGISACRPYVYANFESADPSLPNDGAILPCGQIAHSFFNDTFQARIGSQQVVIDDDDIAWESDARHLYGSNTSVNYNNIPQFRGGGTTGDVPLNQAQHWMVWMRPGGQATVSKPYGVINQQIPGGSTVTFSVISRFNSYAYSGDKTLILTTNSWVGGRNENLGWIYIGAGILNYCFIALFVFGYNMGFIRKRDYADMNQMTWIKNGYAKGVGGMPPQLKHEQQQQQHVEGEEFVQRKTTRVPSHRIESIGLELPVG